jgi:hypothetical protein
MATRRFISHCQGNAAPMNVIELLVEAGAQPVRSMPKKDVVVVIVDAQLRMNAFTESLENKTIHGHTSIFHARYRECGDPQPG